ncbi:SDR family oxidoreductase [Trabulsiella odontotermitis]|uniref:SDR family NAD(P)-dependent oxidoreductase n=1 Tax=Trabulsiella odontotermitis TaxID=379893 RepID=UPI0024B7EF4C|nr:SDR family oxidoreductase [Trabulsiella odontotermitis]WHP29820.1 SDR family oxidoreductase [Trabulsiella odontotermitis]
MGSLDDKVAVITGGNSGIGLAIARLFVAQGARVIIVGRRDEAVKETVALLGDKASGVVGDISDITTHERVAALGRDKFGEIDIYVANAGVINIQPADKVGAEEYDQQFATNTRGVFFGVQKIQPVMREGGSIVLISSIASDKVLPGHTVYAGTKSAIEAFARSWAVEFSARKIRVNTLSPGPTQTPILTKLGIDAETEQQFAGMIPLGRMGHAQDLANAALFLSSEASQFITGTTLKVDGGMSLT